MDMAFVCAPSTGIFQRRAADILSLHPERRINAPVRAYSRRNAGLQCCDKSGPADDVTKILGGPLEESLEDVLLQQWDQLEQFGLFGTVQQPAEAVDDDDVEGDETDQDDGGHSSRQHEPREVSDYGLQTSKTSDTDRVAPNTHNEVGDSASVLGSPTSPHQSVDGEPVNLPYLESNNSQIVEEPIPDSNSKAKEKRRRKSARNVQMGADGNTQKNQQEHMVEVEWGTVPQWHFLQVKPGCEKSCAISIRNMAAALPHFRLEDVLVPTTQTMRLTKGGKSVRKEERMFPGYMLVCMVMNKQNYNDIISIPNVQWFMGDPNRDKKKGQPFRPPVPLSDEEMHSVFNKLKIAESEAPEVKTELRPGDRIFVTAGPFKGNEGDVVAIKPDTNELKASLIVFNRETNVELGFSQVKLLVSAAELYPKRKRGRKPKAKNEADVAHIDSTDSPVDATSLSETEAIISNDSDDGFQSAELDDESADDPHG